MKFDLKIFGQDRFWKVSLENLKLMQESSIPEPVVYVRTRLDSKKVYEIGPDWVKVKFNDHKWKLHLDEVKYFEIFKKEREPCSDFCTV